MHSRVALLMADDEQSLRLFGFHFTTTYVCFVFFQACFGRVGLELQSLDEENGDAELPEPLHVLILQLRVIRLDFRPREIAFV